MNKDQIRRLNEISYEIKAWAEKNFPVEAPKLGMLEEAGELAHCFLKRWQKIRGFEKFEHFVNEAKDALGDLAVYTLHDLRMQDYQIISVVDTSEGVPSLEDHEDIQDLLGELTSHIGNNFDEVLTGAHEEIFELLDTFAWMFSTNILEILEEVWGRVKNRNWLDRPQDAHESRSSDEI